MDDLMRVTEISFYEADDYEGFEDLLTPAQQTLRTLLASLPSNPEILAALKPARVPRGTPSFEEARQKGVRIYNDGHKGWSVFSHDEIGKATYETRARTKAEAKKVARAVAFAGAVYEWTEDNGNGLHGQRCVEGPDWAPYRRGDMAMIPTNFRRQLKTAERNSATAFMAHCAGLITEDVYRAVSAATTAVYVRGE